MLAQHVDVVKAKTISALAYQLLSRRAFAPLCSLTKRPRITRLIGIIEGREGDAAFDPTPGMDQAFARSQLNQSWLNPASRSTTWQPPEGHDLTGRQQQLQHF